MGFSRITFLNGNDQCQNFWFSTGPSPSYPIVWQTYAKKIKLDSNERRIGVPFPF